MSAGGYGLTLNRTRARIQLTLGILCLLLAAVLAASGFYALRWYKTGEMPPAIRVRAMEADPRVDETPVTKEQTAAYNVPATHPRYISIDKLGIYNVRIFPVGLDANNILKTPANINDAAWYTQSATPGAGFGAVMIDAHNGGITRDGVFAGLNKLSSGDLITVERGDGKKYTYSVTSNKSMSLNDVNKTGMQELMQSSDPSKEGLSLITCDGNYVPSIKQYDRRIMLRAVRVNDIL